MTLEELASLEKLADYMAGSFLKKPRWQEVNKTEWQDISARLNRQLSKKPKGKKATGKKASPLGENYIYEHLIIKKLKPAARGKRRGAISVPSSGKLNTIAQALGFEDYIEFIGSANEPYHFNDLRINIHNKKEKINTALLENLVGYWYCYNRNFSFEQGKNRQERIWRSTLEIYKQDAEYRVSRTGKGEHDYYGKIVAYDDYVFIILNSTMLIRQRHFISRIKDVNEMLSRRDFKVGRMSFVSTCVSFNSEPIALYEIFERVEDIRKLEKVSVELPFDSPSIPSHILSHLKDIERNRIIPH